MSEKRFSIKSQDDYWAVVDNYNEDKVCIINGIHTKIEAIWLCDFMNEQQAEIDDLNQENEQLRQSIKELQRSREYWIQDNNRLTKRYNELIAKIDYLENHE